jgi:two-component system sensor histidine kinase PilS (NtrC family)
LRSFLSIEEQLSPKRLYLLAATRLGVATALLGGALTFALENQRGVDSFTPRFLIGLIVTMYGTTLAFVAWQLRSERKALAIQGQIVLDLMLATALVYVTGGASSGFTFLYGVTVMMAALVAGPFASWGAGALALVLYAGLCLSFAMRWLAFPLDQSPDSYFLPPVELVRAGLVNVLGLLLVTVLAGRLAARVRVTGGRLKIAEANAAYLTKLNEDIVRSLASGLLTTDPQSNVQTINPTGLTIFRAQDPKSVIGKAIIHLFPFYRPEVTAVARAEGIAPRMDGSEFLIGYSVNPLTNAEGENLGSVVVFQDLTELALLRDAAKRAERLAILGSLSAGLAHEIRNPLSSISGCIEMVRESKCLNEQEGRMLSIVLNETERLNELVTTMLTLGKPISLRRESQDLRLLVSEVVEMVGRRPVEQLSIKVEALLPREPVTAWVDGDQIRQVLWNLIKNATQASPHGATVRVSAKYRNPDRALLEVSDEGMGIEPGQRERIFDLYYSDRTHGAGIGLALVRQIIDAHGGSIDVESSPQRGATFTVTVPVREA